jgi:hypothetical protein
MYTISLHRYWSALHLKVGCWYIGCGKTFCPEDEDDVKTCAQWELRGTESRFDDGNDYAGYEDEGEDLSLLLEKGKNKIEAKKKKDKERLDKKKEKEALKVKTSKEKAKKGEEMAKEGEEKTASVAQGELLGESSFPPIVVQT